MLTRSFAVIALLCSLFAIAAPALAAEMEGKIQSVNAAGMRLSPPSGSRRNFAAVISGCFQ